MKEKYFEILPNMQFYKQNPKTQIHKFEPMF